MIWQQFQNNVKICEKIELEYKFEKIVKKKVDKKVDIF